MTIEKAIETLCARAVAREATLPHDLVLLVRPEPGHRVWTFDMRARPIRVIEGARDTARPDVVILGREEDLAAVVSGSVSPLLAWSSGRVRVQGQAMRLIGLAGLLSP